jgi:hypothetical protein
MSLRTTALLHAAGQGHGAGRRRQQPGNGAQQGGLPAAGGPDHADEFAFGNSEADVLQNPRPAKLHADAIEHEVQGFVKVASAV